MTREMLLIRARECADKLQGTAQSLADVATEEETSNAVFCGELDAHVFCCEACNWWCPVDEMSAEEDQVCDECAPPGALE